MENSTNKALRDLGVFYCAVFVVSLAACSLAFWLYWQGWRLDGLIPQMANVFTVSVGFALLATIAKEAGSFMVLAAMKIKEWQDKARKEGREEGREEGRKEGRKEALAERSRRQAEAREKFGVEVDGVLMLPQTPEVDRFLAGGTEE